MLTPIAIRGFQALAQLAKFNMRELITHGIFNEEMELNKAVAEKWVAANAVELSEVNSINPDNLTWEVDKTENLPLAA